MLKDEAVITIKSGNGGAGIVSFGKKSKSGPDGGNGGKGGDFYLIAKNDITLLNNFRRQTSFEAQNGFPGGKKRQSGKKGDDYYLEIPVGSSVYDTQSNELLIEFQTEEETYLVAKGGKGGQGNFEFRSSKNTTPTYAQPGLKGEKKTLKIILKLIADFGLL